MYSSRSNVVRIRIRASRVGGEDAPGGLQAVELGHADVHQDDVRMEARGLADGFDAVVGLGDHLDVVLVCEQQPEAGAHHRLVVGDEDADGALIVGS